MGISKRERIPMVLGVGAAAAITAAALMVSSANAAPPGNAAPAFKEVNTAGKEISLADFKGKIVVIEWTNNGCPFVQKHYNSKNMQNTQFMVMDMQDMLKQLKHTLHLFHTQTQAMQKLTH